MEITENLKNKARKIKWIISDCDGVWTDTGVYYSNEGEMLKRFSIRDGMGVERLRNVVNIETAVMTGENSMQLKHRCDKLKISELYLYIKNKKDCLEKFKLKHNVENDEIAYIGDDFNDLEVLQMVGFSACPADALTDIKKECDYICTVNGGQGAFRDFAELIIKCRQ